MDFSFFETLTGAEATGFLSAFLESERQVTTGMISMAKSDGIPADFSVASIPPVLQWAINKLRTIRRQPDESVPSWITQCDSYSRGLFDFDNRGAVSYR